MRNHGKPSVPGMNDSDAQKTVQYRLRVRKPVLKVSMMSSVLKMCAKDG